FGGVDLLSCGDWGCDNYDETWTWDGIGWTQQTPSESPPPRGYGGMAHDRAHRDIVLFGGNQEFLGGRVLGDTHTWDGQTWSKEHPTLRPSDRWSMAVAYDPRRRVIVLFGGAAYDGWRADTWIWDGRSWTPQG